MREIFTTADAKTATYDMGLRAYMIRVYNYMMTALGITGVVAFATAQSPALMTTLHSSFLGIIVALSPLFFVFYFGAKINSMSVESAKKALWIFSVLMGLSLSFIFIIYTGVSIARVFFITASSFGVMSLYGYTTKKDLTSMGSFLIMGLWGIIIASLVNMFMKSAGMDFAISILGVIIFTGLTAYDTQRIKDTYYHFGRGSEEMAGKVAVMGALNLYLDFINLFIMMLRLFGGNRD